MSDNIGDLLKQRNYDEPPEVTAIKKFMHEKFNAAGTVSVRDSQIIIAVQSAALAGTLRMHQPELQKLAGDKKVILRIG
ncbi:MAG: hypothetical protein U5K77_01420 [Candidatus Saccharibacteria bacterium]|nr:hypothetical protein [Candidatus Saccharibacteria bacterium]